jgi:hypothetical protein
MRYPNLRYGNPTELRYYFVAMGSNTDALARLLRRDERTVKRWLNETQPVPWWVPEILRLKQMEADERHRQMFAQPRARSLAVVTHDAQLELRRPDTKKPQAMTDLRLDDFDQAAAG